MVVIWTGLLAASLVIATVLIHYEVLRATSRFVTTVATHARSRILLVLAGIFTAHLLEVSLYSFAYFLMSDHLGLGSLRGPTGGGFVDYYYFSIAFYTTLGIGDVFPSGPMRVVAGLEALNGFVLIGWSTSFTYLAMERFWREAGKPPAA